MRGEKTEIVKIHRKNVFCSAKKNILADNRLPPAKQSSYEHRQHVRAIIIVIIFITFMCEEKRSTWLAGGVIIYWVRTPRVGGIFSVFSPSFFRHYSPSSTFTPVHTTLRPCRDTIPYYVPASEKGRGAWYIIDFPRSTPH